MAHAPSLQTSRLGDDEACEAHTTWFAELLAAYVAREVEQISVSSDGTSWQSSLDDVPALIALVKTLGVPPIFGPRVLRAANRVVARHDHGKTRSALEALGAFHVSAQDREEARRAQRRAEVMREAIASNRSRKK